LRLRGRTRLEAGAVILRSDATKDLLYAEWILRSLSLRPDDKSRLLPHRLPQGTPARNGVGASVRTILEDVPAGVSGGLIGGLELRAACTPSRCPPNGLCTKPNIRVFAWPVARVVRTPAPLSRGGWGGGWGGRSREPSAMGAMLYTLP